MSLIILSLSVEVWVSECCQILSILIVWLKSHPVSVQFFSEFSRLKFIPLVSGWPVPLVFFESLSIKLLLFLLSFVSKDAFVGLNAKLVRIWSSIFLSDESFNFFVCFLLEFGVHFQFINDILRVAVSSGNGHSSLLHL